jgi:hypothetical protein
MGFQHIEQPSFGEASGKSALAFRGQSRNGLVFLFDLHEVFRAEALKAPADLIAGEPDLASNRFFLDVPLRPVPEGLEQQAFGPRESDRGRPDRGISRCLGHKRARKGPD